jgi:CheY-like chemotaxis protein
MAGILICDDNPNIRYLLRVFVESQTPFKICGEADHGPEAIEKARVLQPDLILVDLSMPVMTGAEAASVTVLVVTTRLSPYCFIFKPPPRRC